MIDVPGMDGRIVRVQPEIPILELDHKFNRPIVLSRGKIHESVLVPAQLGFHLLQIRHAFMLA
jgi:hypothetical protein